MSTTTLTPHPSPPTRRARSRWAPLPVVLAGTFMVVLDFFIVNVALPSMQAGLHAGSQSVVWVASGYALTSAVFLITAGRLGDRFGRRRMFSCGLAVFTASSALCGLAPDTGTLIAGRLLQGMGAALVMPNVLTLLSVLYDGEDRAKALAAYGLVMGLAAAGGQVIGGALVQWDPAGADWRSCFLINLPVGIAALIAAPRLIPESRTPRAPRPDLAGTILLTAGMVAAMLPLVEGRALGWPLWTWVCLAAALPLLALLFVHQRRRERAGGDPLVALRLFAGRTFRAGSAFQVGFWTGQGSFFLVLALYLQQGRGLTALQAGLVFTALAGSYVAAAGKAPALTARHGRSVLTAGAALLTAGHLGLLGAVAVIGTGGSVLALVPGLVLVGAGMGLGIAPLATIVLATVPPQDAGAASGALTTLQNVGTALGVAVIGVIYYGVLGGSGGHLHPAAAFTWSVGTLAAVLAGVALLSRRLPARAEPSR